ncbi:MAG: tetratricopeptide repeat protein [Methanobacteriaceae archaeon]|nr:tetratricopeptide repeat protein [Methanobacteriaceae archaeon]
MQCYNCNNIYNDYLGYCPYCGVKKEEFNICSNCEEKLTKDILICPKCGEEPIEETKEMKSDRLNREGVEHQMSDSSIDYFNEALRFNKNNIDAWVNKSKTLNFGTLYKANKCCDAGLKINKDNKKLLLAKAIALKKDERDSDENNSDIILNDLLKRCDQDLQENRFNVDIWILKGEVLNKLDNQKGAIECYSNALEINPKNEKLWVRKAELCWYDSDYISEVESYKKALELNPTNATYYKKIGDAYEGYLNDNKNAIKYYNNALELDYDDKYLWVTKGRLEKEIGKYDDALKSFNFAAKLNPNHDGALLNKAEIFCKLNCFEEAIECYDEALKIFSNDWVKNLKANALIELERYEDALEVYDENIKGNPDYEDTYFKKGKLLNELGRFEEEVECYELLLNEDDCSYNDYKRAQLCKGIALLEIDKEKAENYFNKCSIGSQ